MKIFNNTTDYGVYAGRKTTAAGKTEKPTFASMLSKTSADSIEIRSNRAEMTDEDFTKSLAARMAAEVKSGASEMKLSGIRQQIAFGEYEINAEDIARKILG